MSGGPHTRTTAEVWQEFDNQMRALESSKRQYDSGEMWEAPRLATILHVLVNDGRKKTKSILSQLGIRDNLTFYSSGRPFDPTNLLCDGAPLAVPRISDSGGEYVPMFLAPGEFGVGLRAVTFAVWWHEPIFTNKNGQQLSRLNLTSSLRSKEGGSHFDNEIPASPYLDLKTQSGAWEYFEIDEFGNETTSPMRNAHLASMRQIIWEIELTLAQVSEMAR